MVDLIIAGGGPAGLATAICATQAGFTATIIEPRQGVIDKACGEGLMPPALMSLRRMGVAIPTGYPFLGIRYVDGKRHAQGHFAAGPGRGVRRAELHAALIERARELGVSWVHGRVNAFQQDESGVTVAGLRARWLVAADGLHSPIRRQLGLALPARHPARYGVRRHYAIAPWSEYIEVHLAAGAEAYVTPVADNQVGVAVLFSGKGRFDSVVQGFPELAARLSAPCGPTKGGGPFERRVKRRVVGRVFLVGDAAGFVDPLTGEGVQLAFTAAQALADCLRAGRPAAYERAWRRLFWRYNWMTNALLRTRRNRTLSNVLVPTLARAPWLFDAALDVLANVPKDLRAP
ncbi:MAG: flavin-dependent dehydrogenase [Myxococcota bacterium]